MTNSIVVDGAGEGKIAYTPSEGLQKKDKPAIHTMPKKFLHISPQSGAQAKSVGLIILGVGALFLVAGLIFLYFYFTGSEDKTAKISVSKTSEDMIKKDESVLNTKKEDTKPAKTPASEKTNSSTAVKIAPAVEQASSTESAEAATTTKKTVSAEKEKTGEYKMAPDSDRDGLTDAEELLLGSDLNKSDSDSDGYADADELAKLYNPAGSGKIIVNPNIKKYSNPSYHYALYYPSIWNVSQLGSYDSIMFDLGNEQKIQIVALSVAGQISLEDWYKETFTVSKIKPEQKMYKMGWAAIMSEDGLTVYLKHPDNDNIFSVTYNLAIDDVLHFKSIFMMMVNSIELG